MTTRRAAIRAIYLSLDVPDWAAANLDALADVLRDLSWRPPGPVALRWRVPAELAPDDREAIARVLARAVAETADGPRPVHVDTAEE